MYVYLQHAWCVTIVRSWKVRSGKVRTGQVRSGQVRSQEEKIKTGFDGITPTGAKIMIEEMPEILLETLNKCLSRQMFSTGWKKAKVVWRPEKPLESLSVFRPICLLSCLGNHYEILLKKY
ncbi:hypothetical protein Zmor_005441 [Zophobas morio]|uniref:Uncharacterized protein n=1 Tax=Zophobas morio TaxID=2755281 RepID=A0AA38IXR7_9CUCU|nr:hypothetical protein Zmor_005441 [Zophobas morio]